VVSGELKNLKLKSEGCGYNYAYSESPITSHCSLIIDN